MKTEQELLGSKKLLAVTLRREGMTYREIGEKIGVGRERASQVVAQGEWVLERRSKGIDEVELSVRVLNCLHNAGIGSSRESVKEAIESGVLHPKKSGTFIGGPEQEREPEIIHWVDGNWTYPKPDPSAHYLRNYGWKAHKICCEYAGIPFRRDEERLERLKAEVKRLEGKIKGIRRSIMIDKNLSQSKRDKYE